MTRTVEFRDDDAGYLKWLADHPEGYVINIQRSYNATDAHLHLASCGRINRQSYSGKALTKSYVKRCAEHWGDLTQWATETVVQAIQPCRTCRPTIPLATLATTSHTEPFTGKHGIAPDADETSPAGNEAVHQIRDHHGPGFLSDDPHRGPCVGDGKLDQVESSWDSVEGAFPVAGSTQPSTESNRAEHIDSLELKTVGRTTINGPSPDSRVVEAWSDNYIFYGHRPAWLEDLRGEIRSRCSQLTPAVDEVLHAMYFGAKHSTADVENLLFYNIGTFKVPGGNGIRFEHGASVPAAGMGYPYGYRYALTPRSSAFTDWRLGRELASFGWVDIGGPKKNPTLAQIWLALSRNPGRTDGPVRAVDMPFALRVEIRPPTGQRPVWGALVKRVFDGAICAYQAHTDRAVLPVVAQRIAAALGEDPQEVAALLLDQRNAAIGVVPRLVKPFGAGVQWLPSDEMCVAGELLAPESANEQGPAADHRWAIRGQLVELTQ